MSTINFNANEVEPSTGYDPIPAGKYQAVITESEMKPTKTGNGQYLQLEFEIIEGEYKNRKVWARLIWKMRTRTRSGSPGRIFPPSAAR